MGQLRTIIKKDCLPCIVHHLSVDNAGVNKNCNQSSVPVDTCTGNNEYGGGLKLNSFVLLICVEKFVCLNEFNR